ncbi:MAG: Hsp20/alpha crystallin family protein [Taibaiella sp.]|nr:Hsp20/alpha crystallin family protein [Taibaiella sp.]
MYTKKHFGYLPTGLLEGFFQAGHDGFKAGANFSATPVNIQETDKAYELQLIAPGLKKEDFKLSMDGDILNISYDHKAETTEQKEVKWVRNEYKFRSFKRSFTINDAVDSNSIGATYADGILFVTLPKKEVSEPKVQNITVN